MERLRNRNGSGIAILGLIAVITTGYLPGCGSSEEEFDYILMEVPNRAPALKTIEDQTAYLGESLLLWLKAEDPEGDSVSYLLKSSTPATSLVWIGQEGDILKYQVKSGNGAVIYSQVTLNRKTGELVLEPMNEKQDPNRRPVSYPLIAMACDGQCTSWAFNVKNTGEYRILLDNQQLMGLLRGCEPSALGNACSEGTNDLDGNGQHDLKDLASYLAQGCVIDETGICIQSNSEQIQQFLFEEHEKFSQITLLGSDDEVVIDQSSALVYRQIPDTAMDSLIGLMCKYGNRIN